ncbi:unnamed protein product [marine sediment metagenome]|uniref:Phosphotyrosine protein phosphatase I domain-containing protein n=1 Tax=marine sediment metagenome TaxID=412755 RepID=X0XW34_9ZZZZ
MSGEGDRQRILFVCTGNTCRSPMAEGIATHLARELNLSSLEFRSAGISAYPGAPASRHAVAVAQSHGIDLGLHGASPLSSGLVGWADLVVCMTPEHLRAAGEVDPGGDMVLLTELLPASDPRHGIPVPDPFGGNIGAYSETFDMLYATLSGHLQGRAEG